MRRFLVMVFLLALVSAGAGQMRIGVEAGFSISNQKYLNDSSESIMGPAGGIVLDYRIVGNLIYIQQGVRYVEKGGKGDTYITSDYGGGKATEKLLIEQLQIPLLLKVMFDVGPVKPYIIGGAHLGVTLAAYNYTIIRDSFGRSDADYNQMEVIFEVGTGFELRVGPRAAMPFSVRYFSGLDLRYKERSEGLLVMLGVIYKPF